MSLILYLLIMGSVLLSSGAPSVTLPNEKCVDVDETMCKELWNRIWMWNPTSTPIPNTTTSTPTTTHIVPTTATPIPTIANVSVVCGFNEEFAVDMYRCEETCEEYGDPLCVGNATEGRCYCKVGFVRLKARGICVSVDNRACRKQMPPTNETCDKLQNEELSEWLHDEPCANTCENYNVPCNVTPPAGIFYGPHCVCKVGFSRLSNGKCVDINDTKCKELWNPIWNPTPTTSTTTTTPTPTSTTTTTPLIRCTNFCGQYVGSMHNCSQFDLGMQWSSAGEISGKHCTRIIEPYTEAVHYICFNSEYGVRWSSSDRISGMNCTRLAVPHSWNFLCVPHDSPFQFSWSLDVSIAGLCCVKSFEPTESYWKNNYICVSD